MIRVTALYPNKPDAKFDFDYYLNKHAKMFVEKLAPFGLVKAEIDKGIGGMQAGSPPPAELRRSTDKTGSSTEPSAAREPYLWKGSRGRVSRYPGPPCARGWEYAHSRPELQPCFL